jgi:hypothetical protein
MEMTDSVSGEVLARAGDLEKEPDQPMDGVQDASWQQVEIAAARWAGLFRDEILPELPVHLLSRHFNERSGRPTKELYAMLGFMILQQMFDLTDDEAVTQFAFNRQWHYALNITGHSDEETYVCPKTLWSIRRILTEHGLYDSLFESITDRLAKIFNVDPRLQRLDSVHIFSNMANLGRIGLFVRTIKKFLVNLKRHHQQCFTALEQKLTERYLPRKGQSVFAMVKPSEVPQTLDLVGQDLFSLVSHFRGVSAATGMDSYQLLARLFEEQCTVGIDAETEQETVTIKSSKEVPSDSLQNPSDPDASYDGHKGRGYQVQVAETCSYASEDKPLSLITYVAVEAAHENDANALQPAIKVTKQRGLAPEELLADTLYGGDDNCRKARKEGVELIAPACSGTPVKGVALADFTFSERGKVVTCPKGHVPVKTKHKKERHSAAFEVETCASCPLLKDCQVKSGKHGYYLRYTDKEARLAKRRAHEKTPAFRDKYRLRAGVEATMSEYDRRTGVKHLRVRGLKAVSFAATIKAAGLNILRAAAFRTRVPPKKTGAMAQLRSAWMRKMNIKDQFNALEKICNQFFNVENLAGGFQVKLVA